jgi:hypothetical protein
LITSRSTPGIGTGNTKAGRPDSNEKARMVRAEKAWMVSLEMG